jgi:hypothetical protein
MFNLKLKIMPTTLDPKQIALDAAHILSTLVEGSYKLRGIQYLYISSSDHVMSHTFRGITIAYARGQFEAVSKGANLKLDVFAYYNDKCYQLIF